MESESDLYAAVFRIGSVEEAMVDETAEDALEIYIGSVRTE